MRLEFEPRATAFPLVENDVSEDAFASVSWDFDSLLKKGIAAAQSGDRDHARKMLSQATAINPVSEDAWMWLASISDYPEELLAFLNRVLEINPENEKATEWRSATRSLLAKTFVQRALAARNDGSMERADQCLDQALTHDQECESAWFWKASLAASDDQKLEFLDRVLSLNPDNSEARTAVESIKTAQTVSFLEEARSHAIAGNSEKAVEMFEQLVDVDSEAIREQAWMGMGEVADNDDQKLERYSRVLEINPDNKAAVDAVEKITRSRSQAAFDEARSAAANGDRQKALDILAEFIKDEPNSVDAWLLRSHLSESLDDKVEALEKALAIDTTNTAARSGLAFLALTFGSATTSKEESAPETISSSSDEQSPELAVDSEIRAVFTEVAVEDLHEDAEFSPGEFASPEDSASVSATQPLDAAIEFAYRPTEESVKTEEASSTVSFDAGNVFQSEAEAAIEQPVEEPLFYAAQAPLVDEFATTPESPRSAQEIFGSVAEEADPTQETIDSFSPFAQEVITESPFAAEPLNSPFDQLAEEAVFQPEAISSVEEPTEFPTAVPVNACSFCNTGNDPQAFECSFCNATLTLSDLEKLLSGTNANKEVVHQAVTAMEADWNTRDFSEAEFTSLAIGHFNLGNADSGFRYLQEASRVNPNNVILSGQVNTIAIRLEEMRRKTEVFEAMPKGKKILVVDDSPTVRKLISGKLEKSGHVVICAVDGVDALAKLEEGMPDLVLLDITMPRMDGYEVCKQIRSNPAGKNLPVVMISGKDGFFDKVRGRMAGTSGYVTKPFGPETLMKALETYLLPDEAEMS